MGGEAQFVPAPVPGAQCGPDDHHRGPQGRELPPAPSSHRVEGHGYWQIGGQDEVRDNDLNRAQEAVDAENGVSRRPEGPESRM